MAGIKESQLASPGTRSAHNRAPELPGDGVDSDVRCSDATSTTRRSNTPRSLVLSPCITRLTPGTSSLLRPPGAVGAQSPGYTYLKFTRRPHDFSRGGYHPQIRLSLSEADDGGRCAAARSGRADSCAAWHQPL